MVRPASYRLFATPATYGIPDSLTSDGGPEFASHATRTFLTDWGVHHRMSSAYHPHANCRAEVAVKSMKRLIAGNTGPAGTLSDSFHKALLTYRNGPDPDTKMSPAMCVFGRPTRDLLPGIPNSYRPHSDWSDKLDLRERALSKRTVTGRTRWDEHTQGLSPLKCGDAVLIQNQTGRHPTKWDKVWSRCSSTINTAFEPTDPAASLPGTAASYDGTPPTRPRTSH